MLLYHWLLQCQLLGMICCFTHTDTQQFCCNLWHKIHLQNWSSLGRCPQSSLLLISCLSLSFFNFQVSCRSVTHILLSNFNRRPTHISELLTDVLLDCLTLTILTQKWPVCYISIHSILWGLCYLFHTVTIPRIDNIESFNDSVMIHYQDNRNSMWSLVHSIHLDFSSVTSSIKIIRKSHG